MNIYARFGIVAALLAVIGITLAMKNKNESASYKGSITSAQTAPANADAAAITPGDAAKPHANADEPAGDVPRETLSVMTADNVADRELGADAPADATARESASATAPPAANESAASKAALPRLVDLGAGKCVACKQMAPILENLEKEYAGRMIVEFIDVWENPKAAQEYGIRMIPTQIFFDASGKERFRHEGFYSKEDILGKWKELGVDVESKPVTKG